jgi:hypothetical protein
MLFVGPPRVVGADVVELVSVDRHLCAPDSMRAIVRVRYVDNEWRVDPEALLWMS